MLQIIKDFIFQRRKPEFPFEQYQEHYRLKKDGLEKVLGGMYDTIGHAIIPFQVGGPVDIYRFPNAIKGTALVTMELIEPDGSGPKPSRIGTFELLAFTKLQVTNPETPEFNTIELRIRHIFTTIGRYSFGACLNPHETCEVPVEDGKPNLCVIFDEWQGQKIDFRIGNKKFGLLLCIEIFQSEMELAMKSGSRILLEKLEENGYYPYSDLDRAPVA